MKYIVEFSDPAGGPRKQATVEGERIVLDEHRNHLTVVDADGELVAGFVSWHSFAPATAIDTTSTTA